MKTMKKLLALLLALTMVFALSATAFAVAGTGDYTITIKDDHEKVNIEGETYTAVKIFNLKYTEVKQEDGTMKKVYSYTMAPGFEDFHYGEYWGDETSNPGDKCLVTLVAGMTTTAEMEAFANAVKEAIPGTAIKLTDVADENETCVFKFAEPGYFLVFGNGKDEGNNTVIGSCILTNTTPTIELSPKIDGQYNDKEIGNADSNDDDNNKNDGDGTAEQVGDTVPFTLRTNVPDMRGATSYDLVIRDTMTAGLTLNRNSIKVYVNNVLQTVTTNYTLDNVSDTHFEVNFVNMIRDYLDLKGSEIRVEYTAVINDTALVRNEENNTVDIVYERDGDTYELPKYEVNLYDFTIRIEKVDDDDNKITLDGAKFVLKKDNKYYHWNDTDKKVEWVDCKNAAGDVITNPTVDDLLADTGIDKHITENGGKAAFNGLEEGTYYLVEVEAPKGYNMPSGTDKDGFPVTITPKYDDDGKLIADDENELVIEADTVSITAGIGNSTGTKLPETGGIGTTIFYIVGSIMMIGAAVVLIAKKRTSI